VNDLFTRRIPLLAAQPDVAWRVVFLSGLAPAAVALWIRRRVREPEVWEREARQTPRLAELFAPGLRHATLGGLAMCIVTLVAWWGTNAFLPLVAAFLAGPDAAPSERAGFITSASTMFNLGGLLRERRPVPGRRRARRGGAGARRRADADGRDPLDGARAARRARAGAVRRRAAAGAPHRGSPRIRCAMMFACTSDVPPAIAPTRDQRNACCQRPSSSACGEPATSAA